MRAANFCIDLLSCEQKPSHRGFLMRVILIRGAGFVELVLVSYLVLIRRRCSPRGVLEAFYDTDNDHHSDFQCARGAR